MKIRVTLVNVLVLVNVRVNIEFLLNAQCVLIQSLKPLADIQLRE